MTRATVARNDHRATFEPDSSRTGSIGKFTVV